MKYAATVGAILLALSARPVLGQAPDSTSEKVPIYRVTVVERTMKAINYRYRSEPTTIDFRGTVLLPKAKGEATVQSRQGRTEIDARFQNLLAPTRFGAEYLTYVLWAITPEGRPHNIGEIMPGSSDKASLRVTTDLQAFGLLVTAEPYSTVRQPSDVVVAENQVRPETEGKIEEIEARFELMPRGHYTWHVSEGLSADVANAPRVSMRKYEALLELYQAQNAIAIARSANADQYAPNTFMKAQQLLDEAQQLQASKAEESRVVESARESAQTAEDARVIADRRRHDEKLAQANAQVMTAQQATAQAEAEAQRARAEADAARSQADAERAARQRAESEAAAAHQRADRAEANAQISRARATAVTGRQQWVQAAAQKNEVRMRLLEQLNGVVAMRDTPRGLVATIPDSGFSQTALRGTTSEHVARIGAVVAANPGLRVEVEGHTDSASTDAVAMRRAEAVRSALVARGLSMSVVQVRDLGNSRPLVSNATASGRGTNRRVEIVITGDRIGDMAVWDHTYSLSQRASER